MFAASRRLKQQRNAGRTVRLSLCSTSKARGIKIPREEPVVVERATSPTEESYMADDDETCLGSDDDSALSIPVDA